MEYVAIDFETANGNLTSACSIGIVGADKGKIVYEKYYLINPQEPFLEQNTLIHGLTSDDVKDAKTFKELWDEIFPLLDGNIVFAHAAAFDISVLKSLIDKYDLKYPNIKIGCTLKVARIAFKDELQSFKLSVISDHLQVEHNHHNAISDASICFYMLERVKRMYQVYDVVDLFEEIGLCFGISNKDFYRGCYTRLAQKKNKEIKAITNKLDGMIIAFTGKPEKMTKTEFKKLILSNGGLYSREINRVINTFVVFDNPSQAHIAAVNRLQTQKEIRILTEEEIIKIING